MQASPNRPARMFIGTKFIGGPMDGKVVTGVNMHRSGQSVTVDDARYVATGMPTPCGHWGALYRADVE